MNILKNVDRIMGFFLFLISCLLYTMNKSYPIKVQDYVSGLSILLGVFALCLIFGKENKIFLKNFKINFKNINFKRIFIVFFAILGYVVCINIIGYFPGTVLFITVLLFMLNIKNWKTILITNLFFVLLLYFLFIVFLKLRLPIGIIFE